jgi:hypothetical protein
MDANQSQVSIAAELGKVALHHPKVMEPISHHNVQQYWP